MISTHRRMQRERETIAAMIRIYCRAHHAPQGRELCESCQALLAYAHARLAKCPFQENKPTCARCPIHCYRPDQRDQIRDVMRYAGPRMILRHPRLALLHLLDGLRKPDTGKMVRAGTQQAQHRAKTD